MTDRGRLLLLVLAVAAVYANSGQGSFHYDDFHSIVDNPYIRSLGNVGSFFAGSESFSADPAKGMYRPLLLLTYALNYRVGGYDVSGYHLVNVLLHAGTVLVLWSLARAVGLSRGQAGLAALLFAVHPLCTEPVNYISSRSDLLAGCLYLAALRLYLTLGSRARVLSVVCFGLGLLSKSVVVTLPVVIWLYDWLVRGTPRPRRYLPYWLVAAAYGAVLVAVGFARASADAAPRSLDVQVWTQLKAVSYYLALIAMPVRLNVEHQFAESLAPTLAVALSGGLLASLLWVALRSRMAVNGFWVLWPVLLSLPAALVPLNVLVNERRLYLPLAGLCILLVRLLAPRIRPQWGRAVAVVAVVAMGGLAAQRNAVWADESTLWADSIRKSPRMPRAHVHLGNALQKAGEEKRAAEAYARAIDLDPAHRAARTNLANLLYEEARGLPGQPGEEARQILLERAATQYRVVLEQDPTYREALTNLGSVYLELGHKGQAEELYLLATEADPNFGDGHYNLGRLYLEEGAYEAAARALERAVALQPQLADGFLQLGTARALMGDMAAAAVAYRRACRLAPPVPAHWYNLGEVLLSLARAAGPQGETTPETLLREARQAYERVAALDDQYRMVGQRLQALGAANAGDAP